MSQKMCLVGVLMFPSAEMSLDKSYEEEWSMEINYVDLEDGANIILGCFRILVSMSTIIFSQVKGFL